MRFVKEGEEAPKFAAKALDGSDVTLEGKLAEGDVDHVLLVFSRYFGCPVCQYEFSELVDALPKLREARVAVVYFTQSSTESAREFLEGRDVPFPVVCAAPLPGVKNGYQYYHEYGVGALSLTALPAMGRKVMAAKKAGIVHGPHEGFERQSPAQVLVGPGGIVVHARKGTLALDKVFAALGG
ncbi:MAG: hypothetical protein Kow0069_09250 [Promethearchaeota archaeon]